MFFLQKLNHYLNHFLMAAAGCFLGAMVFLTCANIFLRLVWLPVQGTFELMGYFGAVLTAFALGYAQSRRGHIAVDILVLGFSRKTQKILSFINAFVCMLFFGLVAWQISQYGTTLWKTGEVTETLRIIYYPFTYCVALGCAVLALVFLTEALTCIFPPPEDEK